MMSAECAICSWLAMNAPDEMPATETCAGSTGKAPSLSAACAGAKSAGRIASAVRTALSATQTHSGR